MKMIKLAWTTVFLVLPLAAQIEIPLDNLAAKASDVKGVTLDQSMIKLAANFLAGQKANDPGFQKVLAAIKSITVKRFSFAQDGAFQSADLDPLRAVLRGTGWSQMLSSGQNDRQSTIYVKMDGLQMGGITIIKSQPREVAVVSVEGSIDLAKLAQLAGHMGIPQDLSNIDPGAKPAGPDQRIEQSPPADPKPAPAN